MTRLGLAGHGTAGYDQTRQGKTREFDRGSAWLGSAGRGTATQRKTRQGNKMNDGNDKLVIRTNMLRETLMLIEVLRVGEVGDTITDDQLFNYCGKRCGSHEEGCGNLQSAIRYVEREFHLLWKRVRKGGYIKCLDPSEAVAHVSSTIRRCGKAMRRSAKQMQCFDPARLSSGDATAARAIAAQIATMTLLTSGDTRKRLEVKAVAADPARLLAALLG